MRIMLNKHFHLTETQVFISEFRLLKRYIKHGAQDSQNRNMLAFKHHSRPELTKLLHTTRRLVTRMHIQWQCVSI